MSTIETSTMTISEAAEAAGLSAHTLRYYEREGLIDPIGRADSGHRRYTPDHLERIRFIGYLRATGMRIRTIREYVDLVRAGEHTEPERLELLTRQRDAVHADLAELRRNLAAIERKIEMYRERSTT